MLPLWRTVELDGGSSLTLYRWGQGEHEGNAGEIMRFVLWFGTTVMTEELQESIPEAMTRNLYALIKRSCRNRKLLELSLNDLYNVTDALWELNGLGGDGLKKLLSRYQQMMAARVEQEKTRVLNMN